MQTVSKRKLVSIDYLSEVPIKTEFYFNETYLALGTCFIYQKDSKLYLVSTWHNFAGKGPQTKQPLSAHGGIPNRIKCKLILDNEILSWEDCFFDLSTEAGIPNWYEHPVHGSNADIAILPIELPTKFKAFPINKYSFTDMRIEVAQDVFILGFPLGINGRKELPIWKRASIASEPGGNFPKIMVDTATRKGMSGSPVIVLYRGFYINELGKTNPDDWMGEGRLFLVVYSGRVGEGEFNAQLGIVWKKDLIDEMINSL